jgi:hypothetical protein
MTRSDARWCLSAALLLACLGLAPFVERVLEEAAAAGAAEVILEVNTFGGRVLRRRRLEGPATPPSPEPTLPAARVAQHREPRVLPRVPSTPPAPSSVSRRRPRVRVGSARDARRAIVLIAVLGPCRSLEPPGLDRFLGERNA